METDSDEGYLGALWLVLVAILWGGTNPFLKREGAGIESVKQKNAVTQFFFEMKHLFLNWKYLLAFLINQSGSVVYYLTLASADLSLVAPVTNSLTFIITTLTGKMLGERIGGTETYIGMGLVIAGVTLCLMDKT
ncbi:transmembrane protein 234 [Strongylocentrotus purpuratus]|uniref:Transmembrane protein 234 homolog n=1 Tax=Strongylocentrotus purpuratus TaxID=7668 RepID=A0A7M7SXN8_STRPU|nr:transmembrane protein 234 [Strongylocentrotus purpuratus]